MKKLLAGLVVLLWSSAGLAQTASFYQLTDSASTSFKVRVFTCQTIYICPVSVSSDSSGNPLSGTVGTTNPNGTAMYVQGVTGGVPILASQSGTWTVGLGAGSAAIGSISNTTFAATQSGTWTVGLSAGSNAIGSITNTTFAATESGTWTVQPGNTANTTAWLVTGTGGTFPAAQSGTWNVGLSSLNSVALGSPSNYGTSPGAVSVQGVNAFVTNIPAVTQSGTWNVTVNAALPAGSATIGAVTQASGPWTVSLNTTPTLANGNGVVPTQGGAVLSATNGIYTNLLQGNVAVASGNPIFTQITAGAAAIGTVSLNAALPAGANTIGAVTQASGPWTVTATGFPGSTETTGTPISVTTGGVTGTLPAGAVVVASNVGATNSAYCKLGSSASVNDQPISPGGGWFAFTVGSNTQLTCITSTSTTTVNMVGGAGLPTGAGGGGGGGGGGGSVTQGTTPWVDSVYGPTASGSASANPPVQIGGTITGAAGQNVAGVAVKPASTAAVATDTSLVTQLNPLSPGIIALGPAAPGSSVPTVSAGYTYTHIATDTTTTVKSGAGVLHSICVNTVGAGATITVDDATSATTPNIAILSGATLGCYTYDVAFLTGLTIVTAVTAPDVTVAWR